MSDEDVEMKRRFIGQARLPADNGPTTVQRKVTSGLSLFVPTIIDSSVGIDPLSN